MAFQDDYPEQAALRDERYRLLLDHYSSSEIFGGPGYDRHGRYAVLFVDADSRLDACVTRCNSLQRAAHAAVCELRNGYREVVGAFDLDTLSGDIRSTITYNVPAMHEVAGVEIIVVFNTVPSPAR